MKKLVILLAALAMGTGAYAQKAKIYTAKEYMRNGDMKKAIAAINEATTSESTKLDGDAWFTRGEVYEKLAETDPTALEESTKSYMKVLEVKPNYDKDVIDNKLLRIATALFNEAVKYYQGDESKGVKADYNLSYNLFKRVVDIREINNSKHFASNKKFDDVAAKALKYQALSAYYAQKNDQAIEDLNKVARNPLAVEPFVYSKLIDLYAAKKDFAGVERTLDSAKAKYPKDAQIQSQEINYYSSTGKTELLIKKMEEAVKTDPDNAVLQYNLGSLYSGLANPIDENGEPKTKPANAKDLEAKAEMAFRLAIDADPTKAEYVFNLGALYFNNAADITKKMNAISGTTAADNKKYDELKALRLAQYTKSLPNFQKSFDLLNPKVASLNEDDKSTYTKTLFALQNIYETMNQTEKADDMAKKLKEIGQ
jgi:hypothetical protein